MFGDDMLIAPVTKPGVNGFAEMDIWLPEGSWYELHTGFLLEGGCVVKRHFALDEYGVYIKAGSVLPFYGEEVNNLNRNDEDIYVTVFPGGDGSFEMYEDAGNDKDYAESYATTQISNIWNGSVQTVRIAPRKGSYEDMPAEREFKVKVLASEAPSNVSVNGEDVAFKYLGEDLAFVIDVPVTDCTAEKVIVITYADSHPALTDGLIGLSRRIARSIEALKFRTGADPTDDLAMMGTINEAIMYTPEKAEELAESFMKNYNDLPEILKKQPRLKDADIDWFLSHCGWKL